MVNKFKILIAFVLFSAPALAQQGKVGTIESAEITVEKDRKVVMPDVQKPKDRPTTIKPNAQENKQMVFDIEERKVTVSPPKFNPTAQVYEPADTSVNVYENFVKVGAGNYGRLYLEGLVNTPASNLGSLGFNFKHNNSSKGPKYGNLSANSLTEVGLNGKFVNDMFKLDGKLGFDRSDFLFYGSKEIPAEKKVKQAITKFNMNLGLENANRDASLDYSLNTGLNFLKDKFEAREVEWLTKFNFTLPVTENFYALVHTSAAMTQRSDSVNSNRNLFKVRPTFILKNQAFALTFGINVASERDVQKDEKNGINKNINRTKAFPVINLDYFVTNGLYVFAGYEGDIYRNSLSTFLAENQWLGRKVDLLNTEKSADIYGGVKGEIACGVAYDVKLSYAKFKDFYVFNNMKSDTSKFEILYDKGTLNNFKINANVYYKFNEIWRSSLKVETNAYTPTTLKAIYHMPNVKSTWSNTLAFANKLFVGTDIYFLSKMKGYNPKTDRQINLNAIFDLNAKMNYKFSDHLSSFVYLNNLLSKTYQRYSYYPQQSLNFMIGLSYGFSTNELF